VFQKINKNAIIFGMDSAFKVKQDNFEGPLDLLLDLIEKHKLSISQVSLARVADDFISYIKSFENFPLGESVDFILVASTLVLIKSKSLLPSLELSEEERGGIEDLEARLKLYRRIKEASKGVRELFGRQPMFFASERRITPVFSPHKSISVSNILTAVRGIISTLPKFEKLPQAVVKKVLSLEEMIQNLAERINKTLKMSFRDFSGMGKKEKIHVIVSFLAMLQLVKQGVIKAVQENNFEDITIETDQIGTPKYV
jgi:segregation and condensation protein A